jgi:lipid II:glycine glycyltransferase (peptidoglycan interpeptide bridge formation enzyme)
MPDQTPSNFEIRETMPTPEWDSISGSHPELAGFGQSSPWARIQTGFNGRRVLYLSGRDETRPECQFFAQCFINTLSRGSGVRNLLQKFHILAGSTLEILEGPIIQSDDPGIQISLFTRYLDAIEATCHRQKIDRVKSPGFNHTNPLRDSDAFKKILTEKGYTVSQWGTYLLDLTPDLEKIFARLDHHVRGRIRKADESRVTVSEVRTKEEFRESFVDVFNRLQVMNGRPERPDTSFLGFWQEREPTCYHPLIAKAADGEIVGVLGSYCFNGVSIEITSALHPRCYSEKLPVQDLLHWHQIKLAKEDGSTYFDFAGVNPNPSNAKEAGIKSFKSKWGGQYVEFLRYEKCFNQTDLTLRRIFKKFLREPQD